MVQGRKQIFALDFLEDFIQVNRSLLKIRLFEFDERFAHSRVLCARSCRLPLVRARLDDLPSQTLEMNDCTAFAQSNGTLDGILEFADIARPMVVLKRLHDRSIDLDACFSLTLRIHRQEMIDEY